MRRIPRGFYSIVEDILNALKVEELERKIKFRFNPVTKRVTITVIGVTRVLLHHGVAEYLGFEGIDIRSDKENVEISVQSSIVPDTLARYRVLMIYTDIIEPQIVRDALVPLLRIVNITGNGREKVLTQYERAHYLLSVEKQSRLWRLL